MEIVTLGIDLAKNIFARHGVGADGKVVLQRPAVKRAKRHRGAVASGIAELFVGTALANFGEAES